MKTEQKTPFEDLAVLAGRLLSEGRTPALDADLEAYRAAREEKRRRACRRASRAGGGSLLPPLVGLRKPGRVGKPLRKDRGGQRRRADRRWRVHGRPEPGGFGQRRPRRVLPKPLIPVALPGWAGLFLFRRTAATKRNQTHDRKPGKRNGIHYDPGRNKNPSPVMKRIFVLSEYIITACIRHVLSL